MSNEIPERLRVYIRKNFYSVSLLDVLFILKRAFPKGWTAKELSNEMRTNHSYASSQLAELASSKILKIEGETYIFSPEGEDLELINDLEELYHTRRSTVIGFIYSQPIDSIRNFADAFKIKKD